MPFSLRFIVVISLLLIVSLQTPVAEAENVYLYRLKKLRNNFHAQIEEQVVSNDLIVEKSYSDTVRELVVKVSQAQAEVIVVISNHLEGLLGLSEECQEKIDPLSLYTKADTFIQKCTQEADDGAESISAFVVQDFEQFKSRSCDFSVWFMSAYLTNWETIFGEEHYNDVYNKLSAQVVEWDNMESIALYQFRLDVIKRLGSLLSAVDQCITNTKEFIAAEYDTMYINSLKCR